MMEIPVSGDQPAGPDFFFWIIKGRETVPAREPEEAYYEYRDHQGDHPPINPGAPSGKRLEMPLTHKLWSGGRWEANPTRTLQAPGTQRSPREKKK
jgi:hypothetical protein